MRTSARAKAGMNLVVGAVNKAVEMNIITLAPGPVAATTFELAFGGCPAIADVHDADFDEVAVAVLLNPTPSGRKLAASMITAREWRRYGTAQASAWLERRTGRYLQTGVGRHGTRAATEHLAALTVTPQGFGTKPTKHGYDFAKELRRLWPRRARRGEKTT
jgi:hypothetical protein